MYSECVVSCGLVYIQVWGKLMIQSKSEVLVGVSPFLIPLLGCQIQPLHIIARTFKSIGC